MGAIPEGWQQGERMVGRPYNQADKIPSSRPAATGTDRDRLIVREVAFKEAAHAALALVLAGKIVDHPALQPYQVVVNLTVLLTESFNDIIQGIYKPDKISNEGKLDGCIN